MYIHKLVSTTIQHISCGGIETSAPVGVMKLGNVVPRAGIEHTSLAFWVRVLTITPLRVPNIGSDVHYAYSNTNYSFNNVQSELLPSTATLSSPSPSPPSPKSLPARI